MSEAIKIRICKDRLRIFLILYFFSEPYSDQENPTYKKFFKSEVKIQKIDFLIRNPDYLALELLSIAAKDSTKKEDIRCIVKQIFNTEEPLIRRLEMERFFFGAYEDIDDIIGFLKSIGFIGFSSKKSKDFRTIEKQYYITDNAIAKVELNITSSPALKWYFERCELIKKYFGDLTGTQLKASQYKIEEYRATSYNEYIQTVQDSVKQEFYNIYQEQL